MKKHITAILLLLACTILSAQENGVKVKVTDIDEKGRVNVSRKALLPRPERAPRNHRGENKKQ